MIASTARLATMSTRRRWACRQSLNSQDAIVWHLVSNCLIHVGLLRHLRPEVRRYVARWLGMIALFGAGLLLSFNEQLWRLFDSTAKGLDLGWPLPVGFVIGLGAYEGQLR